MRPHGDPTWRESSKAQRESDKRSVSRLPMMPYKA
jgi:hypothetical protein